MLMRKFTVTSAMVIAALGVTAGTVNAAPAPSPANGLVNYHATNNGKQIGIDVDKGTMAVENGVFKIKAVNGATLAGTALGFRVDDFVFPIAARVNGHHATLTPQLDMAHAVYKPVALPYEDQAPWKTPYDREVAAFTRMKDTIATGATVGTVVGALSGAAIGCIAGAALGLAVTGALLALFGAGPLGGCIIGASTVGFLGTLAGQLFVTAPVAVLAMIQYFTTVNQPFKPQKSAPAK
ncbi:MAG: hypothetical protein J2P17_22465 [Mycobacterium sp.]|nr:hypothetical protein [Mycobacterium sp.]